MVCRVLIMSLATRNSQNLCNIQLLVEQQEVVEGRGNVGVHWLRIIGDGRKWAVEQAVAFFEGEIEEEVLLDV